MNKKIFALLLIMLLTLAVFVACGDKPDETTEAPVTTEAPPETVDPNHEHVWVPDEENSKAATCTMIGKVAYKCSVPLCEETKAERLDRLEHIPDAPATCIHESKCTLCTKVLEKVTDHTYGEPVVVAATCTAEGKSTETCTVCGNTKEKVIPITHQFVETPDSTGTYVEKVCSLCGYSETAVDFTTIIKLDFETDKSGKDYLNEAEGFEVLGTGNGTMTIKEEENGNHYMASGGSVFLNDKELALIKNDKYIVEFDVLIDPMPSYYNASVFTVLPNYGNGGSYPGEQLTWLWIMKINSTEADDTTPKTVGELVSYKNCSADKLNTGYVMEPKVWYHITYVCDWVSGTTQIYAAKRGEENLFVTGGAYELADSFEGKEFNDGVPDMTRDEVKTSAFRFGDNAMKTANYDNVHIYIAEKPIWDIAK